MALVPMCGGGECQKCNDARKGPVAWRKGRMQVWGAWVKAAGRAQARR